MRLALLTALNLGVASWAHGPGGGITEFDTNKDGAVSKEEIAAVNDARVKELQASFLKQYDTIPTGQTAGDGIIKPEESNAASLEKAADWLEHLLEVFDTNDDGVISDKDESPRGRHGLHRDLLEDLDTDDDGTVSNKELAAAADARAKDFLARFLKNYDSIPQGATAGDGTITAEESLAVHKAAVQKQVDALLDRYDANDDGSISAAEIATVEGQRPKGHGGPHRR